MSVAPFGRLTPCVLEPSTDSALLGESPRPSPRRPCVRLVEPRRVDAVRRCHVLEESSNPQRLGNLADPNGGSTWFGAGEVVRPPNLRPLLSQTTAPHAD